MLGVWVLWKQHSADPSLISLMVSVDVKHLVYLTQRPQSCVKVEVAVLGHHVPSKPKGESAEKPDLPSL